VDRHEPTVQRPSPPPTLGALRLMNRVRELRKRSSVSETSSGRGRTSPGTDSLRRRWIPSSQAQDSKNTHARGQSLDSQVDALVSAGAVRVFQEYASGATQARARWMKCLDYLQPGNVLVVADLTKLGRSTAIWLTS
jgi:hypothetical protein